MKHTLKKINETDKVTTYDYRGYIITAKRSYSIGTGKCFGTTFYNKDKEISETNKKRMKDKMDKAIDTNSIMLPTGKLEKIA